MSGQMSSSLPAQIQKFIQVNSSTSAYQQRSYSHQSLLNAYTVSTFLSEATQSIPPLKRNAGLRDLAQRLLLWPGDITMALQRDALKAIDLLEGYVKGTLDAEVKFVEGFEEELKRKRKKGFYGAEDWNEVSGTEAVELERVRDEALRELRALKGELKRLVSNGDEASQTGEFDIHDLAPFIPGFMSGRQDTRLGKMGPAPPESHLPAQQKHAKRGNMNTDRAETLILVEQFQKRLHMTLEELKGSLSQGDIPDLKDRERYLKEMRGAIDGIELKLGSLTYKEKRVDWFA